jgi:hypothetical protein
VFAAVEPPGHVVAGDLPQSAVVDGDLGQERADAGQPGEGGAPRTSPTPRGALTQHVDPDLQFLADLRRQVLELRVDPDGQRVRAVLQHDAIAGCGEDVQYPHRGNPCVAHGRHGAGPDRFAGVVTAGQHPQPPPHLLQGAGRPALVLGEQFGVPQHQVEEQGVAGRVETAGVSAVPRRITQQLLLPHSSRRRNDHWGRRRPGGAGWPGSGLGSPAAFRQR